MKKLLTILLVSLVLSSTVAAAETRNELIHEATQAGLSFKDAVKYAELKLDSVVKTDENASEKKVAKAQKKTAKNQKTLAKLENKLSKKKAKMEIQAEFSLDKVELKKAKIHEKTTEKIKRYDAVEAYRNYIYKDEKSDEIPINPKTGFPEILETPFVVFDEGVTFDMVTRLQKQDDYNRSDFVWQDYMLGAYFNVQSENMKPLDSMLRVAVYYPFYHTFDGMQQFPKQTILYAFDLFWGPMLQADMWKYVQLKVAGGLHYMYQLTDEYHMNYLGLGLVAGVELPVARRWTIVNNGTFTLDYANLGTNKQVQPYDYSWSYQGSLGVRYSKKKLHKYAYIHHIEKDAE